MIGNQLALVRRELWEHRAVFVVPGILCLLIVLVQLTGQTAISAFGKHIDTALLGATNVGANERAAALSALMSVLSILFVMTMSVVTMFYALDALYAERKDKSILFWRSLPVTDAETVISKLLVAVLVIPLISLVAIAVTHLLVLIVTSAWVASRGANAWHLIWQAVPFLDNWGATLIVVLAMSLWMSPFIGWFLLVSAYTKRAPMMMAILPILVLPMLERSILNSTYLADALFLRTVRIPIASHADLDHLFDDEMFTIVNDQGISLISMLDIGRFLSSPGMWAGLFVCALFVTAAIYVRRYRGEA